MASFDEQPVGQPQAFDVPELLPEASAVSSLSLVERLVSRDSKARFDAACELFDELRLGLQTSVFTHQDLEAYRSTVQKLLADSHPGVQEKALECFQVLLDASSKLFATKELAYVIIDKCLSQGKASVKSRALDSLLSIAEHSNVVYLASKELLGGKMSVPKLVAVLGLLGQLLENFGGTSFPVQDTVPQAVACVNSSHAAVKSEAIKYLCEAHRWLQNNLFIDLSPLKPTQQEDLKKLFEESGEAPVPKRRRKSKSEESKGNSNKSEDRKESLVQQAEQTSKADEKTQAADHSLVLKDETNTQSPQEAATEAKENLTGDIQIMSHNVAEDNTNLNTLPENAKDKDDSSAYLEKFSEARSVPAHNPKQGSSIPALRKPSKKDTSPAKEVKLEDIGDLCSPETAEQAIGCIPPEILTDFDIGTWKERQKKLQDLKDWLEANPQESGFAEALAVWLRAKLKDFRENNVSVLKTSLELLTCVASNTAVTKKFAYVIVVGLFEKMGDTKLASACQELFMLISDSATANYVATVLASCVYESKSVSGIRNVLGLLIRMAEEHTAKLIPIKTVLECAKHYLEHSNPQIRTAAIKVISSIYSQLGEEVKPLVLANVKEAVKKTLEAELSSAKPQSSREPRRKLRGAAEAEWRSKGKSDPVNCLAPRTSIAPLITSKLIADITNTSMKIRQSAKEAIDKILTNANNRILSTGLSSLMNALKTRMNEPCKNLAKDFIALVGNLAAAMGPGCKQYSKLILQPLMFNLADKQTGIHTETLLAIDKFAEAAGHEVVFNNMGPLLEKDNPELRTEVLSWILKNKEHLSKADAGSLVRPLVEAMQDRSKTIRSLAEQVVVELLPSVGYQAFADSIKDLKPAIKRSLESLLEKHKSVAPKSSGTSQAPDPMEEMKAMILSKCKDADDVCEDKEAAVEPGKPSVGTTRQVPRDPKIPRRSGVVSSKNVHGARNEGRGSMKVDSVGSQIVLKGGKRTQRNDSRNSSRDKAADAPDKKPLPRDIGRATMVEFPKNSLRPLGAKAKEPQSRATFSREQKPKGPIPKDSQANKRTTSKEDHLRKPSRQTANAADKLASRVSYKSTAAQGASRQQNEVKKPTTMLVKRPNKVTHKPKLSASSSSSDLTAASAVGKGLVPATVQGKKEISFESSEKDLAIVKRLGTKGERADEERGARWPASRHSAKQVEKLKAALAPAVNASMLRAMFSNDPRENADAVRCLVATVQNDPALVVDVLDLVFKWCSVKLSVQSNGSLSRTITEFLAFVFTELYRTHYALQEFESASIIPVLCEQLGTDLKDPCKDLIKKVRDLAPVSKIYGYLMEALNSENNKTKHEALEIIVELMKAYENQMVMSSDIKAISKLLNTNDEEVHKAVVEFLYEIYKERKDKLWDVISNVSETDKALLREKFEDLANPKPLHTELPESQTNSTVQVSANNFIDHVNARNDSEKHEVISQCLELLKSDDMLKKANGLIALNVKVLILSYKDKNVLVNSASEIFVTLGGMLKELSAEKIPYRFVKNYLEIFKNLCGLDFLVKGIGEQALACIMEQLLETLHSFIKRDEEDIRTLLNDLVVGLMNKGEPISVIKALLDALKKCKDTGVAELAVKCLLKLNSSLPALIASIDIAKLLLVFHEHLQSIDVTSASRNSTATLRVIRLLVSEVVKLQGKSVWDSYTKAFSTVHRPDTYLRPWIAAMLNESVPMQSLGEIFKGLSAQATFNGAVKSLSLFMAMHPENCLEPYLSSCSKPFRQLIVSSLADYRATDKKNSSVLDHKMKMKFLMQKLGMVQEEGTESKQEVSEFSVSSP